MEKCDCSQVMKKSKSMSSLEGETSYEAAVRRSLFNDYRRTESRTISDTSVEISVVVDSDSNDSATKGQTCQLLDSGIAEKSAFDGEMQVLEQKIDRLSDMYLEQCRLLTTLKEDIRNSKVAIEQVELSHTDTLTDIVNNTVFQSDLIKQSSAGHETDSRARSLLDAIEARQALSLDQEIRDALTSFLQSDELKDHMVAATAESVRGVVGDCLSRDLSALYLPILEHSHRRLVRQVTRTIEEAFTELEQNSSSLSRSVYKVTRGLQRSVERHQALLKAAAHTQSNNLDTLKCIMEELLHRELKEWRQKVLEAFSSVSEEPSPGSPPEEPAGPPQPASPDLSIIDQLMTAAQISKQIVEGDVNAAFSGALSAGDLAHVVAACRGAERAGLAPCRRLAPHLLLALMQQLSTDVLHDTLLKCRFLEDCIMNLDPRNPLTRAHLPLVVGEVRKHLTAFLAVYPNHVARRRISFIIMASEKLLQ